MASAPRKCDQIYSLASRSAYPIDLHFPIQWRRSLANEGRPCTDPPCSDRKIAKRLCRRRAPQWKKAMSVRMPKLVRRRGVEGGEREMGRGGQGDLRSVRCRGRRPCHKAGHSAALVRSAYLWRRVCVLPPWREVCAFGTTALPPAAVMQRENSAKRCA
jgi:hypothetical protein